MTLWTVVCQAPLSMGFSRPEYWSGLPCPPPGDLPNPGTEPGSPALQADPLPSEPLGKPILHTWGLVIPTAWLGVGGVACKPLQQSWCGRGAPRACSSLSGGVCALSSTWLLGACRGWAAPPSPGRVPGFLGTPEGREEVGVRQVMGCPPLAQASAPSYPFSPPGGGSWGLRR